jgi:hypothetical protein
VSRRRSVERLHNIMSDAQRKFSRLPSSYDVCNKLLVLGGGRGLKGGIGRVDPANREAVEKLARKYKVVVL